MNNYKVYQHINKINGKMYIGITKQEFERRWENGYGYKDNDYFYNAIKKYGWNNFKHNKLYTGLTKEEAQQKEIELIGKYKSNNRKFGYNISKGGETCSENFKKRIGKDNPKSRRIRVINAKTKELIGIWESQNQASIDLEINRKGITKNCLGQSKTYKGYIFEYDDCNFVKPKKYELGKHPNHKKTKVKCIDDDKIFNSINEAGIYYNIRPNNIACCLSKKSKVKTAGGKRWCKCL
jgi:predicted GIY-YIG superfamily endonuclease